MARGSARHMYFHMYCLLSGIHICVCARVRVCVGVSWQPLPLPSVVLRLRCPLSGQNRRAKQSEPRSTLIFESWVGPLQRPPTHTHTHADPSNPWRWVYLYMYVCVCVENACACSPLSTTRDQWSYPRPRYPSLLWS